MKTTILYVGAVVSTAALLTGCGETNVSYSADIQPIITQYCLECHAEGKEGATKSGLRMNSYDNLMQGTRFGSIIKPGDSLSSVLNMLVEGRADASLRMPHNKTQLPKEKIALLKRWVEQGAPNN